MENKETEIYKSCLNCNNYLQCSAEMKCRSEFLIEWSPIKEEIGQKKNQADRFNLFKPKWSQVDFKSLEPMVQALEYGEVKYSKMNWKKGLPATEIIESLLRHAFAMLDGEELDKESGLPHIGHLQSNAMFLSYILREKPEFNDIFKVKEL